MTDQQRLLLAFIGAAEQEIDPIRIMKGQFLLAQETPEAWIGPSRYHFYPYQYGPYSSQVYADLGYLEREHLIRARQPASQSWKYYSLTPFGKFSLPGLSASLHPELLQYARQVRAWVDSMSFKSLLAAVYKKYPEFAVNSVFKF